MFCSIVVILQYKKLSDYEILVLLKRNGRASCMCVEMLRVGAVMSNRRNDPVISRSSSHFLFFHLAAKSENDRRPLLFGENETGLDVGDARSGGGLQVFISFFMAMRPCLFKGAGRVSRLPWASG